MKSDEAEQLRKRYLYRRLIVTGRLKLHRHAAVRLIGPDCAYHLYGHYAGEAPDDKPDSPPLTRGPSPQGESPDREDPQP